MNKFNKKGQLITNVIVRNVFSSNRKVQEICRDTIRRNCYFQKKFLSDTSSNEKHSEL